MHICCLIWLLAITHVRTPAVVPATLLPRSALLPCQCPADHTWCCTRHRGWHWCSSLASQMCRAWQLAGLGIASLQVVQKASVSAEDSTLQVTLGCERAPVHCLLIIVMYLKASACCV
jgi:hypothetical protein